MARHVREKDANSPLASTETRAQALIAHDVVFDCVSVLGSHRFDFMIKFLLVYSILNALLLISACGRTPHSAELK
jgi:hypothetical protein